MKNTLFVFATLLAVTLAPSAFANSDKKSPETAEKTLPKSDKPKTDTSTKPEKIDDLDAFFEEGERQTQEGPLCRPKTKPIA